MAKKEYDVQGLIERLNNIERYQKISERIVDCGIEEGCVVALQYQFFKDEDFSPEDYWESIEPVEVSAIMVDDYISVQDDDSLLELDEDDDEPQVEFDDFMKEESN